MADITIEQLRDFFEREDLLADVCEKYKVSREDVLRAGPLFLSPMILGISHSSLPGVFRAMADVADRCSEYKKALDANNIPA